MQNQILSRPDIRAQLLSAVGHANNSVAVVNLGDKGRGVVATDVLPPGTIVCVDAGLKISAAAARGIRGSDTVEHHWFEDDDGSCLIMLGISSFLNHSRNPTCDKAWVDTQEFGQIVVVYTIRPVATGCELTHDYWRGEVAEMAPEWANTCGHDQQ